MAILTTESRTTSPHLPASPERTGTSFRRFFAAWRALAAIVFWATSAASIAGAVWLSLSPREQVFDTQSALEVRRAGTDVFEARFHGPLPDGCVVSSDGKYLTAVRSPTDVERDRGRSWIDANQGVVRWSRPADAPPLPDGQRAIAWISTPGRYPLPFGKRWFIFLLPAMVVAVSGFATAAARNRETHDGSILQAPTLADRLSGGIDVRTPSSTACRMGLTLVVAVVLGIGLVPGWNRLVTCPDTRGYVVHSPMRTPLVPWWIDAFDSQPGEERVGSVPSAGGVVNHWGAGHRYVNAVRAWKVLLVASVCVLTWWLATIVPWWLAGSLLLAAVSFDAGQGVWSKGMTGHIDVLFSEGISYALTFFLLAGLCAYLSRPTWTRGLVIALLFNALLLTRPACIAFATVFGVLWLADLRSRGFRGATGRAAVFAGVTVAGILLHCSANQVLCGHFQQHAFTGFNLITTTLQLAEPADAEAFADRRIARLVQTCTVDYANKRPGRFDDTAACTNCWLIAVPAFRDVYGVDADDDTYLANDVFLTISRTLIRRRPLAYAALAWTSFREGFWNSLLHVPLLFVIAFGVWRFVRTGDWRSLAVAYVAALPFISIAPACLTNYPFDRYRSVTYFAEIWSVPLFVGVLLTSMSIKPTDGRPWA